MSLRLFLRPPLAWVAIAASATSFACQGGEDGPSESESSSGGTDAGDGDSGGSGGSLPNGTGATGSDSGGSTISGAGGMGGSTAGDGPNLGTPCATAGESGCALANARLKLLCGDNGTWESDGTCDGGQVCDPREDTGNFATCQAILDDCEGQDDDVPFCLDSDLVECSTRGLETSVTPCGWGCDVSSPAAECFDPVDNPCGLLIDDLEDGDGSICEGGGRGGPWFSWAHNDPLSPSPEGYMGGNAMKLPVDSSQGFGLKINSSADDSLPYDASVFTGVRYRFYVDNEVNAATHGFFVVTTAGTEALDVPISTSWTQVSFTWEELGLTAAQIESLEEFQWNFTEGASDPGVGTVWVDDVTFF